MSERKELRTGRAPAPRPSNSQAVVFNGMIFCSGSIGVDPATSKLVAGSMTDRAASHSPSPSYMYIPRPEMITQRPSALQIQAIRNVEAILSEAGATLADAIKVNVYLTNMDDFGDFNKVYERFFTGVPRPSRTCVCVKELPLQTDVEIEVIAALPTSSKL